MRQEPLVTGVEWDEDAPVWCTASHNVLGLGTEGSGLEALVEKLKMMASELLGATGQEVDTNVWLDRERPWCSRCLH